MFQLSVQDIHPGEKAGDKEEAIRQVAAALVQAGNVAEGYVNGMLAREQQTSTFLGNGIAIPHGTTDTRDQVLKTGVQVFQFPEGVTWGDGQVAYVAIGIAASSDEHLGLLRQLTHVLSDDSVAEQLKSATTAEELRALLMGEKQSEQLKLDNEMLTLDIVASDLLTLQALNAARLKEAGAVDATFVTKAINEQPLNLGQGIWLSDSAEGNLRSAIAVSRAANAFDVDGETAAMLVSVAMNDDQPIAVLKRLKITINRPQVRNAFRPLTVKEMIQALADARYDDNIGVIILTGAGDKAFCSGGDQKVRGDYGGYKDDSGVHHLNVLDFQRQIRTCPKPVVAMVAGYSIGGGHVLHMMCDLTIAADNAIFGQTGPKVGSFDGGWGASYMARIVGQKKAREIWFLCRQYDAKQALDMGLVNTVVPLADLEKETVRWCREMLQNSPMALRCLKAALNADCDGQAGLQELAGNATMLFYMTEEGQEGRNAFNQKRQPDFSKFKRNP